ncbi:YebC/PmpR family DNA-binding transcriptional regulator [bacterium]|nr:YebC/PmpR family DNA-binding transcriptional regulator [bacterium]
MSGHSKWSTIKRKKGAADAKRGKIFTKVIHEISVAVREGKSGDAASNPRLRLALDKAKACNLPGDTVDRAIKRALGGEGAEQKEEVTYEGYGPGGVAVLVETITENRNRTVGEVRHAFTKCGGALGEAGCVGWMFKKKGLIAVKKEAIEEEALLELVLGAGAEDVSDAGELWEVICEQQDFINVKTAIDAGKLSPELAEVTMIPATRVALEGKNAEQMERLIEMLDELDDVMNVSTNAE